MHPSPAGPVPVSADLAAEMFPELRSLSGWQWELSNGGQWYALHGSVMHGEGGTALFIRNEAEACVVWGKPGQFRSVGGALNIVLPIAQHRQQAQQT